MRDEIFGPVLAVGKFATEAEAIQLANNTTYGLGAGLHSSACNSVAQPAFHAMALRCFDCFGR